MAARKQKTVRTGRPSQLCDPARKAIIEAVGLGCTYQTACDCAGIATSTFRRWMAEGRRDKAAKRTSIFSLFLADIKKAESEFIRENLDGIKAAAAKGVWTARAWLLERRHPDQFSQQRGEIRQLTRLAEEQAKRIADLEAKLQERAAPDQSANLPTENPGVVE